MPVAAPADCHRHRVGPIAVAHVNTESVQPQSARDIGQQPVTRGRLGPLRCNGPLAACLQEFTELIKPVALVRTCRNVVCGQS